MNIGDTVKIKTCDSKPELVGENAEIVEMQIQQYEKYRIYPMWAKMTSGECKDKIFGFLEHEVASLPAWNWAQEVRGRITRRREKGVMKTKVLEQLEELLEGVIAEEEFAEIDRVIEKAKGKIQVGTTLGFWEGKTPCWEMFRCPEEVRNECPAFKYKSLPCWKIEGTYCKLFDYGAKGDGTDICRYCRVYKKWGSGEPIEIKLFGKGFNLKV